jgi:cellobiose phosphorylase
MGEKSVRYFNMINPINHSTHKADADQYKVEPYVATADVYGEPPLSGTGGWSWYTGSGGWMYRVALESILGFRLTPSGFEIQPSISSSWPHFNLRYRPDDKGTEYEIKVENPEGLENGYLGGTIDGDPIKHRVRTVKVPVLLDGKVHKVELTINREKGK